MLYWDSQGLEDGDVCASVIPQNHVTHIKKKKNKNKINPWYLTSEDALLIILCCAELLDSFYLVNMTGFVSNCI